MISLQELEKYYQDGLLLKQTHPNHDLIIWNYSPKVQYDRLWDDITIQCRGLVTNSKGEIIARPFKKFFNYEEHTPEDIPNEFFEVYEKMDGSLGILFNYEDEWIMATRGSFTSEQAIKGKELLGKYRYQKLHKEYTYLFEIIYKENRIVCEYNFEDVILLGMIHTKTGDEVNIHHGNNEDIRFKNMIANTNIPVVTLYKTWGEGFDLLREEIPNDKEGYVIRFKNGFRMKIKGNEYKRLHKILTGISSRDIWEYLKDNKSFDEIINRVPDEFYNWISNTADNLVEQYGDIEKKSLIDFGKIITNPNIVDRKSFALEAVKCDNPSILFSMLNKNDYSHIIWKLIYPTYSKPFKNYEEEN